MFLEWHLSAFWIKIPTHLLVCFFLSISFKKSGVNLLMQEYPFLEGAYYIYFLQNSKNLLVISKSFPSRFMEIIFACTWWTASWNILCGECCEGMPRRSWDTKIYFQQASFSKQNISFSKSKAHVRFLLETPINILKYFRLLRAKAVGAVTYSDIDGYRFNRDVLFCYDLKLPEDFLPINEGKVLKLSASQ